MKRFVILLDGDLTPTERLKRQVLGCRVIAADGGIRHAAMLDLEPEIWLGDFDSAPHDLPPKLQRTSRIAYPEDKNETDGELAVEAALKEGADELLLIGAFGGRRADHALLHKLMALQLAVSTESVFLSDGIQEGYPILPGSHSFEFPDDTLFSLVGFSDLAGLTITGARWPLHQVEVPLGSSWTLSNRVAGDLEIELKQGRALLIARLDR